MLEIENPYQTPNSLGSRLRNARYQRTSRLKFLYVVALILSLSFGITLIAGERAGLSLSNGLAFYGLTVLGPFMTLGLLFWAPGPLAVPIWAVAICICSATFCYLVRPNNVSLVISACFAVTWVLIAPVLLVLLPELGIRI